jgi:uncharacterized protein YdeI (YjbR/CyaY-like superfamily)
MSKLYHLERFEARNRQEWRQWLEENHLTSPGIWLIYYKKGANQPTISYDDAVEEALSFGWIDSTVNKLDKERYMQLFTPRKAGSTWSRLNKQRIKKLGKNGLMMPAGIEKVEKAKKDGSWNILNDVEDLIVPKDLKEALSQNKDAQSHYNSYTDSVKKQILWWISSAKKPQTRKNRVEKVVLSAENGKKPF